MFIKPTPSNTLINIQAGGRTHTHTHTHNVPWHTQMSTDRNLPAPNHTTTLSCRHLPSLLLRSLNLHERFLYRQCRNSHAPYCISPRSDTNDDKQQLNPSPAFHTSFSTVSFNRQRYKNYALALWAITLLFPRLNMPYYIYLSVLHGSLFICNSVQSYPILSYSIYQSQSLQFFQYLSIYLSIYYGRSNRCGSNSFILSVYICLCFSLSLSYIYIYIYIYIYPSLVRPIYLSIYLPITVRPFLSFFLSFFLIYIYITTCSQLSITVYSFQPI